MSELSFGPNSLENQQNENSMNATNMETPPQIAQTGQNAPGGNNTILKLKKYLFFIRIKLCDML